jgi:hypothetical protein
LVDVVKELEKVCKKQSPVIWIPKAKQGWRMTMRLSVMKVTGINFDAVFTD